MAFQLFTTCVGGSASCLKSRRCEGISGDFDGSLLASGYYRTKASVSYRSSSGITGQLANKGKPDVGRVVASRSHRRLTRLAAPPFATAFRKVFFENGDRLRA
jgi:hypothetical protein